MACSKVNFSFTLLWNLLSYKSISHHFPIFATDCQQNSHFPRECFIAFSLASRNSFIVVSIYLSKCVTSHSQNIIQSLPAYLWTQKKYLCEDLCFRIPNYVTSVTVRSSPYNGACWAAGNFHSFPFALLCWFQSLNREQVDGNSKIEEFKSPHLPKNFTFCFRNEISSGFVKCLLLKKDTVNPTSSLRTQLIYWLALKGRSLEINPDKPFRLSQLTSSIILLF